ncbi:MAG: VanZ family protein [Chloroflexota bacterium]|nr:VanZ family protein [Chloroflexota bacterium]
MLVAWAPALLWSAFIFFLSAQNTWTVVSGPPAVQVARKSAHIVEYSILGLLVGQGLLATWTVRRQAITRLLLARAWRWGVAISTLYGASDEIHQSFVPRREFHITDIVIDGLSATAALGIWYIARTYRLKVRSTMGA